MRVFFFICCLVLFISKVYSVEHNTDFRESAFPLTFIAMKNSKNPNIKPKIKLNIKQSISSEISKKTFISMYSVSIRRFWKAKIWTKIESLDEEGISRYPDTYIFGGGFESPVVSAGNFQEYGAYKYFGDITNISAWSGTKDEYTRWNIRTSPIRNASRGVRLALPYTLFRKLSYQSYNPLASVSLGETLYTAEKEHYRHYAYFAGGSLGYKVHFWEPRFLYRYSWKEQLDYNSTRWDSWYISDVTALRLQQFLFIQKFSFSPYITLQTVASSAVSDTYKTNGVIQGTTVLNISIIQLSLQMTMASSNAIHDEWAFQKFLWESSAESIVYYKSVSYVKLRTKVAEYNQKERVRVYPRSLYKTYSVLWKHYFDTIFRHIALQSKLEWTYTYTEYDEYYKQKTAMNIEHGGFGHSIANNVYWYIDEESRAITSYKVSPSIEEKYKFSFMPVASSIKAAWEFKVKDEYPESTDTKNFIYDTTDTLIITGKLQYNIARFFILGKIVYSIEEDTEIRSERVFKSVVEGSISIRYNW